MSCDSSYWTERIAVVKALIEKFDAALLAVGTQGIQQYQLDTGQTRMLVSKANLATVRDTRSELLNELATLEARVYGAGSRGVPGW